VSASVPGIPTNLAALSTRNGDAPHFSSCPEIPEFDETLSPAYQTSNDYFSVLYDHLAKETGEKASSWTVFEYLNSTETRLLPQPALAREVEIYQLLNVLRMVGANKAVDRITYLVSNENAEDGGDIPAVASINAFVRFYLDNPDLGEPLLGVTPNGELQAVWVFPDKRRLVAEFLADDTIRYLYRRTADAQASKFYTTGRLHRRHIRTQIENAPI